VNLGFESRLVGDVLRVLGGGDDVDCVEDNDVLSG
jgi:hypothetical protein